MPDLSADERALLEVLAAAEEPMTLHDMTDGIVTRPVTKLRPGKVQPEWNQWADGHLGLLGAATSLLEQGMAVLVPHPGGSEPGLCVITDAGREALDKARDACLPAGGDTRKA